MSLLAVGSIIEAVGKVAGDLITTDKVKMEMEIEQRKLDLEEKRIDQATDLAQIEVNKIEAASSSVFVSGWRPAIGWIGVAVPLAIEPARRGLHPSMKKHVLVAGILEESSRYVQLGGLGPGCASSVRTAGSAIARRTAIAGRAAIHACRRASRTARSS